jgi:hypothetical protein
MLLWLFLPRQKVCVLTPAARFTPKPLSRHIQSTSRFLWIRFVRTYMGFPSSAGSRYVHFCFLRGFNDLSRSLGIKTSLNFSSHCTHLICPSREGIKCAKAKEWDIPIVGFDWVIERKNAAASEDSKTPTNIANEGDDGNLKVAKSMQDMHIETDAVSRPALPEGVLFSPVFKVSSRNPVVDGQPPSPTSPSPQRRNPPLNAVNSAITPSKPSNSDVSRAARQSASKPFPTLDTSNNRSNANPPEKLVNSPIAILATSAKKLTKSPFNPPVTQRIPSSATPSPLATRFIGSSSKVKEELAFDSGSSGPFSLQSASAKALSRNIGAILGSKRAAEDDPDAATSSATSGAEGPRKRPRRPQPNRSTVCSEYNPCKSVLNQTLVFGRIYATEARLGTTCKPAR